MSEVKAEDFLSHYGVKGMRWGQRKGRNSSGGKMSRKERKAAKFEANVKQANDLIAKSLKDPKVLINLNGRMIVTGKEFTTHMANGGLLDVKTTKVYAELDRKNKTYVLQ